MSSATETQQIEAPMAIQLQQPDDPSPVHDLPPPPVPSSDPRLSIDSNKSPADSPTPTNNNDYDLFKLKPTEALQLLSASVELLVRITGDVPPTPPPKTPTDPQMSNMQAEKENIARSHSEKSLARLRTQALLEEQEEQNRKLRIRRQQEEQQQQQQQQNLQKQSRSSASSVSRSKLQAYSASMSALLMAQQDAQQNAYAIDGVRLKHDHLKRSTPSSSAPNLHPPEPYVVVGADSQPLNLQHGAITRKFYSKNEPPISVHQYLLRLHQFCPMSTAVYLATSLYIHRLAVEERAIPVTRRNAHRLVLAGLRVAMKALEDLSYPHTKIAKVGGVSEVELARLEISFCFLAGFELVVTEELLKKHWQVLKEGKMVIDGMQVPKLKLEKKRKTSREVSQLSQ
ncbi:cyclin domain-containing protein [Trichoderma sp. SZMC 28014]